VFNAFMPVFWVLLEILESVISCVTNVRVRVRGASRKEFGCEVVDGLADWVHLECSMQERYRSTPGKIPSNTEAFRLMYLKVAIITYCPISAVWTGIAQSI
jgi:hypothetical protein